MKRIHQGGHHDVWCDDVAHVRTEGGYVWPNRTFGETRILGVPFKCDCAFWNEVQKDRGPLPT